MTCKNAIEILEEVKTMDDSMFAYSQEYNDALDMAIEALKAQEQEPIVPIRRSAHAQGADDVWYECGKCGEFLGVNPYSKQFCANCERRIKW